MLLEDSFAVGKVWLDDGLPQFPGSSQRPMEERSVEHDSGTKAGTDPDRKKIICRGILTPHEFAPRCGIGIVFDGDGDPEAILKDVLQRNVPPRHVARGKNDSRGVIDRAGDCDSDACRLVAGLAPHDLFDAIEHRVDHRVDSAMGFRWAVDARDQLIGIIADANQHVRCAKIDTDVNSGHGVDSAESSGR
jgi:hypothetical protein